MPRIEPLSKYELAPQVDELMSQAENLMGFTANDALTMARKPGLMHAFALLVGEIYKESQIDGGLKRLIGLLTSAAAGCEYCVGHTALGSERNGVDPEKLAAVWEFESHPSYSPAERVALRVAMHAGQSPNGVTDEMFAELGKYFDADAQLEIVSVIALFGFLNRWNATLATELEGLPTAALQRARNS